MKKNPSKRPKLGKSRAVDCTSCKNFRGPARWPDKQGISHCAFNQVSLAIQLGPDGRRRGVWFCREFTNASRKPRPPVAYFEKIRHLLERGVLYTFYGKHRYLIEHRVADLEPTKRTRKNRRPAAKRRAARPDL